MSKYIDIGANLTSNQFFNIEAVLEDADKNNVQIVITGTNAKKSVLASEIVKKYPKYDLYSTAGIHPHDAQHANNYSMETLSRLLANPKVIMVGETGLDYNRLFSPKEKQIQWFRKQLDLAVVVNKPVFLHERDAFDDFYRIITEYKDKIQGVVHCFTGNLEQIKKYVELGLYIGFTGFICDNRRNRSTLLALKFMKNHLDKILVETDSPFMSPNSVRPNVPSNVRLVVDKIAKELGISHDDMAKICYDNTKKFLRIN